MPVNPPYEYECPTCGKRLIRQAVNTEYAEFYCDECGDCFAIDRNGYFLEYLEDYDVQEYVPEVPR